MRKLLNILIFIIFFAIGSSLIVAGCLYLYLSPKLPEVSALKEVEYQIPLRVYTKDLKLIGEFGEKRRIPIEYADTPIQLVNAIISAEDDRFFQHPGVDIMGLGRAALELISTGSIQSGGSTITMQVARNFFLNSKQEFTRKFNEILLSFRIENTLSKEDILALYINKIYLGNRSYGFAAAAQVYYGRKLDQLTLAEYAMLAGLPKAPSRYNPIINPDRALTRRNWILGRMLKLDYISQEQYESALHAPVTARYHGANIEVEAPFVAEMARRNAINTYGLDAYNNGLRVVTTIDSKLNSVAQQALIDGLLAYDQRHGFREPENHISDRGIWPSALKEMISLGNLEPAIVENTSDTEITVLLRQDSRATIAWNVEDKYRRYITVDKRSAPLQKPSELVKPGDVVRVVKQTNGDYKLSQLPKVQGAILAMNPKNGAIIAISGGFDFNLSRFNRATQADRQPGSNFKPFLYATALEHGFTPATLILDAPVVEDEWRPENDSGKFYGPTRLREALYRSRNLVSVRILKELGLNKAINGIGKFGFNPDLLPRNLSLSLGSHAVKPIDIATGYATFANGGYKVKPYIIEQIIGRNGEILFQETPTIACDDCPELLDENSDTRQQLNLQFSYTTQSEEALFDSLADLSEELGEVELDAAIQQAGEIKGVPAERILSAQTAYMMDSILKDVIIRGTGTKAQSLKRNDIAGKTGTTNGPKDAWFSGYSPDMVTTAWVGFDDNSELGRSEYGGSAALPIWIEFMKVALQGKPERYFSQPSDLVMVRIDPKTGKRVQPGFPGAIFEYFRPEQLPEQLDYDIAIPGQTENDIIPEDIF